MPVFVWKPGLAKERDPIFPWYAFRMPSLAHGIGTVIDLRGQAEFYTIPLDRNEVDSFALYSDLLAIGTDFRAAIGRTFDEGRQASATLR